MRSIASNSRLWLVPAVGLSLGFLTVLHGLGLQSTSHPEPAWPHSPPAPMTIDDATDRCLMPVADGRPTKADVGKVSRMVSDPTVLPDDDRPWLSGFNRGGQWTIDAAGRYVRFPGRKVGQFGLPFIREATTGRILTSVDDEVLALDRVRGFVPLAKVVDQAGRSSVSLRRIERLDLTLVITRSAVRRLKGDLVEPWTEGLHVAGDGHIEAVDLPALHAVLFLPADGSLKLRYDDGRWETVERSDHYGRDYWVERVDQSERSSTALIWTRRASGPGDRVIALFGNQRDGSIRLLDAGPYDRSTRGGGPQIVFAAATGDILKYEQPGPGRRSGWSRLAPSGYEPIPGGVAPSRDDYGLRLRPVDLPRQRAMAFDTENGVAIYQNGRMRHIPGPPPTGLDELPEIVDLPSIDRTLIVSRNGLFEIASGDQIARVEAPFSTGGLPPLSIFEDERRRQAVIHAVEGLFTLDRHGVFRRIPSPNFGEPNYDEHVATLSISGDHLLTLGNALWLLTSPSSPRWGVCLAGTDRKRISPVRDAGARGRKPA